MKHIVFIVCGILFLLPFGVQADSIKKIATHPKEKADYYPWITYLSQGPTDWLDEKSTSVVQGRAYRIVVLTSEIYDSVYIEEITSGDEGCCVSVTSIRKLDLDQLFSEFGIVGERTGFKLIRWLSPTSVEFSIHSRKFRMTNIADKQVEVREL